MNSDTDAGDEVAGTLALIRTESGTNLLELAEKLRGAKIVRGFKYRTIADEPDYLKLIG